MKYRDRINSHEQLRQLCDLLQWGNASDADDSGRPYQFARQRKGFYGYIWEAILEILLHEAGIERDAIPDPNFGGDANWYEDLMVAVDNASYTTTAWFSGCRNNSMGMNQNDVSNTTSHA